MKKDIHPKYGKCIVKCACGNTFETRSTKSEIFVEICSVCHPFYTGKKKIVDSTGRVDRYKQILKKKEELKTITKKRKEKIKKRAAKSEKDKKNKTIKNKDLKK